VEPFIVRALRRAYRAIAGPEASLSTIPRAILRRVYGSDYTMTLRGKPFTVNLGDAAVSGTILAYRAYEPLETALMQRLVKRGDYAIDVGANIGYFSVLLGEIVGETGRVAALEPEPNNVRLLAKNVSDRGLESIVAVVDAAAGEEPGVAQLFLAASENMGDHHLYRNDAIERGNRERAQIGVRVLPVDDVVAPWPRVDFIKMDIQGFEPHALAGMTLTLERNPGVALLTEFWPFGLRAAGSEPIAYLERLRGLGFRLWEVSEATATLVELDAAEDRRFAQRVEPDRNLANVLCARSADRLDPGRPLLP
jgi:FkbM family methyltransferase